MQLINLSAPFTERSDDVMIFDATRPESSSVELTTKDNRMGETNPSM